MPVPVLLQSGSRPRHVVTPRQVAMYLAHVLLPEVSWLQLGKAFRRDHTTVLHGYRHIMGQITDNERLAATVEHLHAKLEPMLRRNNKWHDD